jgi:hypothetical protein
MLTLLLMLADAACSMTRPQDGAADWSIGSGGREEGGTDADFQGQRTSGQPATGKTRHAIDVTVKAKPLARKVGSSGGRMSRRGHCTGVWIEVGSRADPGGPLRCLRRGDWRTEHGAWAPQQAVRAGPFGGEKGR